MNRIASLLGRLFLAVLILLPGQSAFGQEANQLGLTAEEQGWLQANTVRVGPAPNFPPVEFFHADGVYRGIVADYAALIQERLGTTFQIEQRANWSEVVEGTLQGEIDVWFEAAATDERREYMLFTEPYLRLPSVIIVRDSDRGSLTVDDLAGLRVAAVEGYAVVDYLRERTPGVELVMVESIAAGLERLAFGGVEALVAGSAQASYYIEELGLTNLRVAGESGWEWELSIGVRRELPLLFEALGKALNSISPDERRAIFRRWVSLQAEESTGTGIPPWVLGLAGLASLFLLFLLFARGGKDTDLRIRKSRGDWIVHGAGLATIIIVVVVAFWARTRISERMTEDVGDALQTVLNTTSQAVNQWLRGLETEVEIWSRDASTLMACRATAGSVSVGGGIVNAEEQTLAEHLSPVMDARGLKGYLLLDADGTVSSGYPTELIGSPFSAGPSREFLDRVSQAVGGSVVALPDFFDFWEERVEASDALVLIGSRVGGDQLGPSCTLVFLVDPEDDFSAILQRGRIGESGESYAFDGEGRLLSASRFEDDLRAIGLVEGGDHGILGVQIRDPGGNMVGGFLPETPRSEQPLTLMAESAMSGGRGSNLEGYRDYRGVPVIGAWTWDEITGLGIATELDVSEAYASLFWVRRTFLTGAAVVSCLILLLMATFRADSLRRHRMGSRLRRQSTALEAAVDGIVITETDGAIVWVNPAFEALTGYTFDEAVGGNPRVLKSGTHDEAFYKQMWETVSRGDVWTGEVVNRRKDGSLYTEEMSITPVEDHRGEVVNYVAIKRDISERKAMEAELEQARHRMEDELNVGREIQMSMLPLIFPPFPDRPEFEVHAALQPAREVGGDFYAFFLLDEDHFCFCVGDVSGKGVPAALFMAVTKTLIESRTRTDYSPASVLTHVNDEISRNNDACMFVTIFLGILDLRSGTVVFTNAGHNPPYIRRPDGSVECLAQRHGPVVGAVDGTVYSEDSITLASQDQLVLFTDGVTEAMDPAGALYGEGRLEELLRCEGLDSTQAAVSAVMKGVEAFEGSAEQADDITLLSVQFAGRSNAGEKAVLEVTLKNRLDELERVRVAAEEFMGTSGVPVAAQRSVAIALDELLNNTISYGYPDDADREIDVRMEVDRSRLSIVIRDDGIPFNPLNAPEPSTALSLEDREPGGLGLHLVRKMMDDVSYQRLPNKNVVTLVKRFD